MSARFGVRRQSVAAKALSSSNARRTFGMPSAKAVSRFACHRAQNVAVPRPVFWRQGGDLWTQKRLPN
jgi:hypothetical protein